MCGILSCHVLVCSTFSTSHRFMQCCTNSERRFFEKQRAGGWTVRVRVGVRVRGQRFTVTLKSRIQWFCISWHAQCLHVTTKHRQFRRAYQVYYKFLFSQWCTYCCGLTGLTGASGQGDGTLHTHRKEGVQGSAVESCLSHSEGQTTMWTTNYPALSRCFPPLSRSAIQMFQIPEARRESSLSNAHVKRDVLLFLATF